MRRGARLGLDDNVWDVDACELIVIYDSIFFADALFDHLVGV